MGQSRQIEGEDSLARSLEGQGANRAADSRACKDRKDHQAQLHIVLKDGELTVGRLDKARCLSLEQSAAQQHARFFDVPTCRTRPLDAVQVLRSSERDRHAAGTAPPGPELRASALALWAIADVRGAPRACRGAALFRSFSCEPAASPRLDALGETSSRSESSSSRRLDITFFARTPSQTPQSSRSQKRACTRLSMSWH